MGHTPIAAINAACHCSLAVYILLLVALLLLTGWRAWLRRDKTIHGALLAIRFGLAWAATVLGVGVALWLRSDRAGSGPPGRPQLVARADSICAAAVTRLENLAEHPPGPANTLSGSFDQAVRELRTLTPPADMARDWRRFVAGFAASAHYFDASEVDAPSRRAIAKGAAAGVRLGVDCQLL